ncbi:MAG: cytochrome c biogenesis protein CcdA [Anaerolineaceae bacterium]|jgi:cytochrome c-type biogenesis protein|nr:cytochrome c biogenesis protein CcdA [Anaerolineaceae bacterium]
MDLTLGLAFLAGLASFLSPCVFSLVPAYISYLSGRSIAALKSAETQGFKWEAFSHGLAFVLGFSLVFISLGATASAIGGLLYNLRWLLAKIGGVIVIIFGLHMTGILRIPFLEYDLRIQNKAQKNRTYLSSMLMGVFFSAGWSPCVGPVLGAILTLAVGGGSIFEGMKLLSAYSAGLAIPFLLAALGIGWVVKVIQKYGKTMRYVEIVMGVILIIIGAMLFFGTLETMNRFGLFIDFGL